MEQRINRQMLLNFVLNDVSDKQHERILNEIKDDEIIRGWYIQVKREFDVERYLNDEMTVGEKIEFEEILKKDPKLNKHFVLSNDINKFLKEEIFKEQLNNIHTELFGSDINEQELVKEVSSDRNVVPVKKLKHNVLWIGKWVAAASIVFLIGFSSIHMYLNNRDSLENRLYAKHYEPYTQVSAHLFNSSKLSEAKRLYSEGEYATALLLLDNLQDVLLVQNEKYLYSGMSLMELDRYKEAIEMFKKLHPSAGNETDVLIGYWYIGLCYLKTGDPENAVEYFKIIIDNNGYNKKQAEQILKKLN